MSRRNAYVIPPQLTMVRMLHRENLDTTIERKILHILEHFPTISPSMIQISIGSGVPADVWQPVLERLIASGDIHRWTKQAVSPGGRCQTITYISINPEPQVSTENNKQ